MDNSDLLGTEVYGFEFKDSSALGFSTSMKHYIGKIGTVILIDDRDGTFKLKFGTNSFWYPTALLEANRVDQIIKTTYEIY